MLHDESESDLTSSTTYGRTNMTKSTSIFDLSTQGGVLSNAPAPSTVYHNHKYPSYMQNLPVCKSLQKAEEVKRLKTLLSQRESAIERLKEDRSEAADIKICLNAFTKINQNVANLKSFVERNELKALYQIIKSDWDELRKMVKEIENQKSTLVTDIEKLNEELKQMDTSIQQFHLFIENSFKTNHSIDNIHERFSVIDKDDQNEAYNIPCTHPTLFRGMLHIYTKYLAFESIVLMSMDQRVSRTLVISIDHIQQMSKSHSYLHDCGIILHVKKPSNTTVEKIEFSDFKNTEERDKAFDTIFGLAFNAKE